MLELLSPTFKIFILTFFCFTIRGYDCNATANRKDIEKLQGVYEVREKAAMSWPQGIVNYYFDRDSYDEIVAQKVRSTMNVVEAASCIKFKPLFVKPDSSNNTIYWLYFTNPQKLRECPHTMSIQDDGSITVALGLDCLNKPQILHSILHALGIPDEITHPSRDQYVRIQWQNILPEHRSKFGIMTDVKVPWEYDPQSIMHFHDRAFSKNGRATISPMLPGLTIAPSDHLSQIDRLKLRTIFERECNKRKVKGIFEGCKNRFSGTTAAAPKDEVPDEGKDDDDDDNDDDVKPYANKINKGDGVIFALI